MKLDLTEILGNVGMRYEYAVAHEEIVDEDLECSSSIDGEIVFTNTGSVLLIEGEVAATVTLLCGRCLAYYDEPLTIGVEEQFEMEPQTVGLRGKLVQTVIENDENPDAMKLFSGPLFDLTELLRQNITLMLPIRPLCAEDCNGLCPTCGKDLNEEDCGCAAEAAAEVGPLGRLLKEKGVAGDS